MISKLLENTIPRFLKGKTHKSMRMVRPIDLDGMVDEINAEFSGVNSTISNLEAQVSAIPAALPYKRINLLVTQTGGATPTANELYNDTGAVLTWFAAGGGNLLLFSDLPIFLDGKTDVRLPGSKSNTGSDIEIFTGARDNVDTQLFFTTSLQARATGVITAQDDVFDGHIIEIIIWD